MGPIVATVTVLLVTYIASKVKSLAGLEDRLSTFEAEQSRRWDGVTNRLSRIEERLKAQG